MEKFYRMMDRLDGERIARLTARVGTQVWRLPGGEVEVVFMDATTLLSQRGVLWWIEQGFRVLKGTREARPVFHWTERRVRAHLATGYAVFALFGCCAGVTPGPIRRRRSARSDCCGNCCGWRSPTAATGARTSGFRPRHTPPAITTPTLLPPGGGPAPEASGRDWEIAARRDPDPICNGRKR